MELKKTLYSLMLGGILLCLFSCAKEGGSRYLVGIGIYFGKPKKKETFIYNSS